jgi:hypothetical protein
MLTTINISQPGREREREVHATRWTLQNPFLLPTQSRSDYCEDTLSTQRSTIKHPQLHLKAKFQRTEALTSQCTRQHQYPLTNINHSTVANSPASKHKNRWGDLHAVRERTPTKGHGLEKKISVSLLISKLMVRVAGGPCQNQLAFFVVERVAVFDGSTIYALILSVGILLKKRMSSLSNSTASLVISKALIPKPAICS